MNLDMLINNRGNIADTENCGYVENNPGDTAATSLFHLPRLRTTICKIVGFTEAMNPSIIDL